MNGFRSSQFSPWLISALLGLSATTACTFGPRTGVLVPPTEEESTVHDARAEREAENDKFVGPKAEWVTENDADEGASGAESNGEKNDADTFELGWAKISLGERPPWLSGKTNEFAKESTPARVTSQWKLKKSIWVGQGYLGQAAFTPGEKGVVTLSTQSGEFYHYNLAGKLLKKIALPDFEEFEDVEFAVLREATDRVQLIVTRESGTSLLDLESGKFDVLTQAPAGNVVDYSGRFGLYGFGNRSISPQSGTLQFRWLTGELAASFTCKERPDDWALSADGKTIAIQYYPSNQTQVVNLETKKIVTTVTSPKWGGSVALSPDGTMMALGGEKLVLVRLPSGEVIAEDAAYENNIHDIRFTTNGDTLIVSAYDGKARSYTLPEDLKKLSALPKPQALAHSGSANVYAIDLSREGTHLVTSSGDKSLKIWTR